MVQNVNMGQSSGNAEMRSAPVAAPGRTSALAALSGMLLLGLQGQPFVLPTPNRALYEDGGEEKYFVATPGRTWTSGTFGCVRSGGNQMHEGIDIRSVHRDKKGEPADGVFSVADGTVAYVSRRPGLSNYGNYLVVRHLIDGIEIYSLYAHLEEIHTNLRAGSPVSAGETIGLMGRTANTRQRISRDRAHLHFELCLLLHDNFSGWYKKRFPSQRNDHGDWNGQNLVGIDPAQVFLAQEREGSRFSLLKLIQERVELCRVLVRKTEFPWLDRYRPLVRENAIARKEGIAGYEIALDYNGVPFELIPRAASEIKSKSVYQLVSVNEHEQNQNPARDLVTRRAGRWQLTDAGLNLLGLLTY